MRIEKKTFHNNRNKNCHIKRKKRKQEYLSCGHKHKEGAKGQTALVLGNTHTPNYKDAHVRNYCLFQEQDPMYPNGGFNMQTPPPSPHDIPTSVEDLTDKTYATLETPIKGLPGLDDPMMESCSNSKCLVWRTPENLVWRIQN